jgi:hypothetical protein
MSNQDFIDIIDDQLKGIHSISKGDNESYFSNITCEGCLDHKGGDRHDCVGLDDNLETYDLILCTDCVMYLTYGDLPFEED